MESWENKGIQRRPYKKDLVLTLLLKYDIF